MVFPLLSPVVSARKFSFRKQNKPQWQNPAGLGDTGLLSCPGDTLGYGDVLRGLRALLRALVSIPTLVLPAGTPPSLALWILQCQDAGEGMQKCRILTQTQTPAVRGAWEEQEKGPGVTAPPEQGSHLPP